MRSVSFAALLAVSFVVCTSVSQAADEQLAAQFEASRSVILAAAARIDQLIDADRKKHDVEPSLPANDQIFMRRVYLDITGTIPTGQEALDFLNAKEKTKREILIDYVDRGVALFKERGNRGKMMSMSANKKPSGPSLARASEMRQPAPPGHFLRDFGASDRELVEGSNQDPTVSQILTLINGKHHYQIVRVFTERPTIGGISSMTMK